MRGAHVSSALLIVLMLGIARPAASLEGRVASATICTVEGSPNGHGYSARIDLGNLVGQECPEAFYFVVVDPPLGGGSDGVCVLEVRVNRAGSPQEIGQEIIAATGRARVPVNIAHLVAAAAAAGEALVEVEVGVFAGEEQLPNSRMGVFLGMCDEVTAVLLSDEIQ